MNNPGVHCLIFAPQSIRAMLEGRKTQTRRVVKPQPSNDLDNLGDGITFRDMRSGRNYRCPHGEVGDLIWVREAFQPLLADDGEHGLESRWRESDYKTGKGWTVSYPATDGIVEFYDMDTDSAFCDHVTPSIHMPRWASRLTLRITDVRVQRVQEISHHDAIAEGEPRVGRCTICDSGSWPEVESAEHFFMHTWDSINAKRGYPWESNPLVWVRSFEVIHANVDAVLANGVSR